MGKKYLETKGTSLESSILGMWEEEADRVDGRTKSYKEHRARLEARRIKAENKKKSMNEGSKEEYEKFFNSALKKFKIDSPADLKSDEEKKKFFNYVDKNYTGEKDEEFGTFIKEKMKEGLEDSPNKANSQHLCAKNVVHEEWGEGQPVHGMHAIPDSEGKIAWYDVMFEHGIEKGVSINELNVIKESMHNSHNKDHDENDDDKKMLSAGKMAQMHQMMKDKKSAEEIAKAMKLDLKTVKALMSNYNMEEVEESYEIGTDEYRKHTQEITPGQEITDYQRFKVESMKEALAKVWGLDESKKEEKSLTKEVKGGKTMTGKKVNEIDVNPKIEGDKEK